MKYMMKIVMAHIFSFVMCVIFYAGLIMLGAVACSMLDLGGKDVYMYMLVMSAIPAGLMASVLNDRLVREIRRKRRQEIAHARKIKWGSGNAGEINASGYY